MKTTAQRKAEEARADALQRIADWKHPIGTVVYVVRDMGDVTTTTTRSEPWLLSSGDAVIMLKGISGGFLLDRVYTDEAEAAKAAQKLRAEKWSKQ